MTLYLEKLPDELQNNPFFHFGEETNFVPAWDTIKTADMEGAAEYAFTNLATTVMRISADPEAANFKNTIEPLEEAFSLIGYFFRVFYSLTPVDDADEALRTKIEEKLSKKWFEAFVNTFNSGALFVRCAALYTSGESKNWTPEEELIAGMYCNGFVESGIRLDKERQKAHHQLQKRIFMLGDKIQKKMRKAGENVMLFVDHAESLKGIPQDVVDEAAVRAAKKGKPDQWAFLSSRVTFETLMRTADDRKLRQDAWELYYKKRMTGDYRTSGDILDFAKMTFDAAHLKNRKTPASQILKYNMAKTPKTVAEFLMKLRDAAMPVAQAEFAVLTEFAQKNLGIKKLKPWDVEYVEEGVKKALYGYSEQDTRAYFELEATLEKMIFPHFRKQIGVKFTRAENYPSFHEDVRAYDVTTKAGRHLGVLFLDLYDRPGKMSGVAWSMSVLPQGTFFEKVRRPVNKIDMKLTKPTDGKPTLMTHYDLAVLMHELGHSMHDIRSECKYSSRSGTGVDTDFVEFPSQFQEFIAYLPEFLKTARHHETGEKIPDGMMKQIVESRKFMAGRGILDRSMRSWLDLQWHNKNPHGYSSVKGFEDDVLKSFRLPGLEYPLYSPAFSYTFGGGYDSAFYSYLWSQVMSDDLLNQFAKKGLYDKDLKAKFAQALARGGTVDEAKNYRQISGRNPPITPLLRATGLRGKAFNYAAALVEPVVITIPDASNDDTFIAHKCDLAPNVA